MGDFSITPQLKFRRADRQRGHIVMVKTFFFRRIFSNIHTNIHLNNLYNYNFVCVVQGGWRPSALYWPAATGITTGVRPVIHIHQVRMRTLVRASILRLSCLHACIFHLKSAMLI